MKKTLLIVLALSISIVACKNNSDKVDGDSKKEGQEQKEEKKELVIKMGFKTNVSDVFKISLNNIQVDELQKKNIQIFEKVSPSTGFESIVANFGPNNFSNRLIISLGNREVKKIELNAIEVSYGEKIILISKGNFNKYLKLNGFVKKGPDNFSLTTMKVNGKHNPAIIGTKILLKELENKSSDKN